MTEYPCKACGFNPANTAPQAGGGLREALESLLAALDELDEAKAASDALVNTGSWPTVEYELRGARTRKAFADLATLRTALSQADASQGGA